MSTRVIGITGGVGMGKSTAAKLLREQGVPVLDSDDVAREVVAVGEPALTEISEIFGADFLNAQGEMDRAKMAAHIFGNDAEREKLEAIIHPRVRERWLAQMETWRADNVRLGVVVIPLLFEVGAEGEFDSVICVACTGNTQRERLRARGWDDAQIAARIAAQMDVTEKIERADQVVWTEGDVSLLREQLQSIFRA
ncbi:MAG TPA: dephospho-CoA kinase [Verrucomicrobiales bacterium]|nr:dephospho-CoA kinase [Verrucomicrobiales bacterium]HIL24773.1 dephospho-CoA kinase [Verrucomicrobiota bacterium]